MPPKLKEVLIAYRDILSRLFAISHSYFFTAILWRISLRKIHDGEDKFSREKVILLSRAGGNDDVQNALRFAIKPYSYYLFSRSLVKHIFTLYLDGLVSDADYRSLTPNIENKKTLYRKHLAEVLSRFKKLFGLSAFIEFNIIYYAEKELAEAAKSHKICFITLHKECLRTEVSSKLWGEILKKKHPKFNITSVGVYNEVTKRALLEAGFCEQDKVVVTGCSRMDFSHQQRIERKELVNRKLVYFMIQNTAGLANKKKGIDDDFEALAVKVTRELIELAHEMQDIEFIFKTKIGQSEIQKKLLMDEMPSNIKVIYDGIGHNLLMDASVVVGFNSTAVFEAIASGCQVVSPELFSEVSASLKEYVFDLNGAAYLPRNSIDFSETIKNLLAKNKFDKELSDSKINLLNKVLGNGDGKAGERLMKLIEKHI